jgi:membrane protease YdiL (CAAX protease family)
MFQGAGSFNQRPTPWSFNEGLAVLARGGALSIFLIAILAVVPYGVTIFEDYGSFLLYLPTLLLASVWLCPSKNPSLLEVLGCKNLFQRFRSSLPILMSVVALGLIGDWLIMLGGAAFEISVHWTEWFIPQLVWGSQAELLKIAIEVAVAAPIFEELIFRGIVFSTLRAKFGFTASMIGSAMVFALAHGYGPIAFLAVFWSGLLWAWLYERTGSVVPGMCAHVINNGLVVYFLVAVFR